MEGIVHAEGKTHQEQRRFMITTLRDFGFGKSDMESFINEEVRQFCDEADKVLISAINKEDVSLQLLQNTSKKNEIVNNFRMYS